MWIPVGFMLVRGERLVVRPCRGHGWQPVLARHIFVCGVGGDSDGGPSTMAMREVNKRCAAVFILPVGGCEQM